MMHVSAEMYKLYISELKSTSSVGPTRVILDRPTQSSSPEV
jgi:hypothetical protein